MSRDAPMPMANRPQPDRETVLVMDRLMVLNHPLCNDLLAVMRDRRSDSRAFGSAASLLAQFVIWEAVRQLRSSPSSVEGFDGSAVAVQTVVQPPAGLSILRAGEIFSGPFRTLFQAAPLYHLGVRRDEQTLQHECYLDTVPDTIPADRVMILDPMLATGGTMLVAIERVRLSFSGLIDVLALVTAPFGAERVLDVDAGVRIVTAVLDERLNDQGYIVPGLGDAGDRFYGTSA